MNLQPSMFHFYHFVRVKVQTPFKPLIFKQLFKTNCTELSKRLKKKDPKNRNGQIFSTL